MNPIKCKGSVYEDLAMCLVAKYLISKRKQKRTLKRKPQYWVNNYLLDRKTKGRFYTDFPDLAASPELFKENFRMSPQRFEIMHNLIEASIKPTKNTRPMDFISTREKLAVTLEYLASGTMFRHIASCYRISKQHIGDIIEEVCSALIFNLTDVCMPIMTKKSWIESSNKFNGRWNMPNCLGAIDGKHCSIKCPPNSGSLFYNYKGFYSVVLLGLVDAEYQFMYFDIGAHGSEGDSGVFRESSFGKQLYSNGLNLPEPAIVNGKRLPYFFVADDAFPLHKHIMKPYKPSSKSTPLPEDERIFNYRLSRARRTVENAFGILCARWMCLARSMFVNPSRAQKIITACVMLHNYLSSNCKYDYIPQGFDDTILSDGTVMNGTWRHCIPDQSFYHGENSICQGRPADQAKLMRDHLKTYLNSPEGSLSWQRNFALHKD